MSQLSLKNIRQDAFSLLSLDRCFNIVNPATEKTLSDGAEVAGMHKYFRAITLKVGKDGV